MQTTRPLTPSQHEHSNADSLPAAIRTIPVGAGAFSGMGLGRRDSQEVVC